MTVRTARAWHGVTAVTAAAALVLQLVLVLAGSAVLSETGPPPLGIGLARFVAYFTIQANTLVLLSVLPLVRDPAHDAPAWRVVRTAAVVGITVTGVVHFLVLRPLLSLDGADWLADRMLHVVVPVVAVAGWLAVGPRPRVSTATVGWALVWPIAWLVVTLAVGGTTGWYPYPFLDVDARGWGGVVLAAVVITVLFVVVAGLVLWWDRRRSGPSSLP